MGWVSAFTTFTIIWWTVLFAVLPLGVRRSEAVEAGHDPGAPENPQILRKMAITTGISIAIFAVVFAIVESDLISFRRMAGS